MAIHSIIIFFWLEIWVIKEDGKCVQLMVS